MKYTSEIFQRLSKGQFVSSNSIDAENRAIYNDIEDNFDEYAEYFSKIDFILCAGDGYFYFSRKETKVNIENKLQAMFSWIDILDFLKTYDTTFSAGTQFKLTQIENRLSTDIEIKEKLKLLYPDKRTNHDKLKALADDLMDKGYAECVNVEEESYQMTTAFHYIEQIIMCININEGVKDEIPE